MIIYLCNCAYRFKHTGILPTHTHTPTGVDLSEKKNESESESANANASAKASKSREKFVKKWNLKPFKISKCVHVNYNGIVTVCVCVCVV